MRCFVLFSLVPACIELSSASLEFGLGRVGLGALSSINIGGGGPGGPDDEGGDRVGFGVSLFCNHGGTGIPPENKGEDRVGLGASFSCSLNLGGKGICPENKGPDLSCLLDR